MIRTLAEDAEERVSRKASNKAEGTEGQRVLLEQIEAQFPPLSEAVRQRVSQLPEERIEEIGLALLKAKSLRDLGLED